MGETRGFRCLYAKYFMPSIFGPVRNLTHGPFDPHRPSVLIVGPNSRINSSSALVHSFFIRAHELEPANNAGKRSADRSEYELALFLVTPIVRADIISGHQKLSMPVANKETTAIIMLAVRIKRTGRSRKPALASMAVSTVRPLRSILIDESLCLGRSPSLATCRCSRK
jgi:hypothetical protein